MTKATAKTTLEFKGQTYPFYKTIRGQWDFEQAGFSNTDIAAGKVSAMYAYIYFQLRDCAKRAGTPIEMSLTDFVDQADGEELLPVYGRLLKAEQKLKEEGKTEPGKPHTEEAGAKT